MDDMVTKIEELHRHTEQTSQQTAARIEKLEQQVLSDQQRKEERRKLIEVLAPEAINV